MTLEELHAWLRSDEGIGDDLLKLRCWSTYHSVGVDVLRPSEELASLEPDWRRLLLAASVLAESEDSGSREAALMTAHAALTSSTDPLIRDVGAVILSQLSNYRAIQLAQSRDLIEPSIGERVGVFEQMLVTRRRLETSIYLDRNETIAGNEFQYELWRELKVASWTSATAPTATGKTFLVLNWVTGEVASERCKLAVFLAPTRALVSEIEKELLALRLSRNLPELRVASLPLPELGDRSRPTILVFTQERLHVFLNSFENPPRIDIAIVDEVQKLGDGLRGVILQDAIERIGRSNESCRFVFLSPNAENPESLVSDAPDGLETAVVPGSIPTVTQNLLFAAQKPRRPREWELSQLIDQQEYPLGDFNLHARPSSGRKRVSFVALALGRGEAGTLVYANGPDEAEKIAWQIYDGLDADFDQHVPVDEELVELSDFCRRTIHPRFQLVELVKRGVAFHYGNMPSLLRSEIERLFRSGKILFLVCTSTLVEGVNLSCRSIVVRGPRKGKSTPMTAQDFWNLAGRAGRWGADFHGNIICIDVARDDLWPYGVPSKRAYSIRRQTDDILQRQDDILEYIRARPSAAPSEIKPDLEHVAAYLMAWYVRTGSISESPTAKHLAREFLVALENQITAALETVQIPEDIVTAHPGVSALALQSLLEAFRDYGGSIERLLPAPPESDDAVDQFAAVFQFMNRHFYPAFVPDQATLPFAFVTVDWMRGKALGRMIGEKIEREQRKVDRRSDAASRKPFPYARCIREVMRDVEEVARFRAPKYLSAYMDVLKLFFAEREAAHLFPADLAYDLYLEFGVSTKTLLSLISIGLSRTSAIELNEFLAQDDLGEVEVLSRLETRDWEALDLPSVVKRDIQRAIALQRQLTA